MTQEMKQKNFIFPSMINELTNHFNETNSFLESKDKALSPLEENFGESDLYEELSYDTIIGKITRVNSNVFLISNRTIVEYDN